MKRRLGAVAAGAALTAALFAAGTSDAQSSTEITLLHGIPGATVDVKVDGAVILTDVQPGDINDLSSSAGTQLVDVEVIDTSDDSVVVSTGTLDLPADGNHSLVAHLDESGVPVLTLFENDTSPVSAGARLTVRHTAAAPEVNVMAGGGPIIENLANGASQSIEVAPGVITDAALTLTNGDSVASIPVITVTADVDTIVYAVGSAADATLTFVSQEMALPGAAATTTTTSETTTTTDPNATTTTATATTVVAAPTAVNTGSPLDSPRDTTLVIVAIGGLLVTGGALLARRRVG